MMWRFMIGVAMTGLATQLAAQESPAPRPVPVGSPGAWIPQGAYPPAAKASAEEGRVAFTLDVDERGGVIDCKVTKTSESPLLDETTCNLMMANGRFTPPRDKKGKPVQSKWSSAVTWKLETPPPATPLPATTPVPAGTPGAGSIPAPAAVPKPATPSPSRKARPR